LKELISFFRLETIATSNKHEYLSSQSFIDSIDEGQEEKMNKIYKFIMANFKEQISIDQLASEVNDCIPDPIIFLKQHMKVVLKIFRISINSL